MKVYHHSTTVLFRSQNSIIANLKQLERCQTVIGMKASGAKRQESEMALGIAFLLRVIPFMKDIGMKVPSTASEE